MKLIIEIPETMIQELKDGCFGVKHNVYELAGCIMDGIPLDDIETLKHRSYLEGFHKAYQMYYKMFDDIKAEIEQVVEEEADDTGWSRGLHYALIIIDKHTKKNIRHLKYAGEYADQDTMMPAT